MFRGLPMLFQKEGNKILIRSDRQILLVKSRTKSLVQHCVFVDHLLSYLCSYDTTMYIIYHCVALFVDLYLKNPYTN